MKVFLAGKKSQVSLTKNDFIAQGGQGSVYGKGDVVYKIYTDINAMIPVAKIHELQAIDDSHVIKPVDVLLNEKGTPIGYTMRYLRDTHPLCKIFTKAFKTRENVTEDNIRNLVQQMRETIAHVHSKKVLIVDLNEMNFMVDPKFHDVYFIDVDSYQTPHYPANALMESVRDRLTTGFNEGTDWFAFGIVSFQMFIGIHPFKGKHAKLSTMDERMHKSISVLNKDVSIPATCAPFSAIPKGYYDWYIRMFEKGERLPPPDKLLGGLVIAVATVKKTEKTVFKIEDFFETPDDILGFYESTTGGAYVTVTRSNTFLGKHKLDTTGKGPYVFSPLSARALEIKQSNRKFEIWDAYTNKSLGFTYDCKDVAVYENRIYYTSGSNLMELTFWEQGGTKLVPQTKVVGQVLENAAKLYEGCCVQSLLGTWYVSLFPESGKCYQSRIKELDGYTIVEAKFSKNILMTVSTKQGKYYRAIITFSPSFGEYQFWQREISYSDLNFVVLPSGVALSMDDEDRIEMFSTRFGSTQTRLLEDKNVVDVRLYTCGGRALFSKGKKLCRFSLQS